MTLSKSVLNFIASGCFLVAAVAFFITGPWWAGVLFLVAAACSLVAAMRPR